MSTATAEPLDAYATLTQAAAALGISERTLSNRVRAGVVGVVRRFGRTLVPVAEVERLKAERGAGRRPGAPE